MKKYIVQDGDTLASISTITGVREGLLVSANPGLTESTRLEPGAVISVPDLNKSMATPQPTPASAPNTPVAKSTTGYFGLVWPHVVQQGETWESVSHLYQVAPQALQQFNQGHARGELEPGAILYVPNVVTPPHEPDRQTQLPGPGGSGFPVPPYTMPGGAGPSLPNIPNVPMPFYPNQLASQGYPMMPGQIPFPFPFPYAPGHGQAPAQPSPGPQGPYGAFPGGMNGLTPRAVDALWRKANDAWQAFGDDDESDIAESSWDDGGAWGEHHPG